MNEKTKTSIGLVLAFIAIIISFTVPEIRLFLGLDEETKQELEKPNEEVKNKSKIFNEREIIPQQKNTLDDNQEKKLETKEQKEPKIKVEKQQIIEEVNIPTKENEYDGISDNASPIISKTELNEWFEKGLTLYRNEQYTEAAYWYEQAAMEGHSDAQNRLGVLLGDGLGVKKDTKRALEWVKLSAESGHHPAQNNLGILYYNGIGTQNGEDYKRAYYWLKQAALSGLDEAQNNLGWIILDTNGNTNESLSWLTKAAEQNYVPAFNNLGLFWYSADDDNKALNWFHKAATQEYAEAQYYLGEMYNDEGNSIPVDIKRSIYWYEKAAKNGYLDAQKELGDLYYYGFDVPENIKTAIYWLEMAAKQGDGESAMFLSNLYEGEDNQRSFYWLEKAANQRIPQALYKKALFHIKRRGGADDAMVATMLLQNACSLEYEPACKHLGVKKWPPD